MTKTEFLELVAGDTVVYNGESYVVYDMTWGGQVELTVDEDDSIWVDYTELEYE